jgi:hypothetical protein
LGDMLVCVDGNIILKWIFTKRDANYSLKPIFIYCRHKSAVTYQDMVFWTVRNTVYFQILSTAATIIAPKILCCTKNPFGCTRRAIKNDCNNYRGISLQSTSYNILFNIFFSRLSAYIGEITGDHQFELRRKRSDIDTGYWRKNENTMKQYVSYS